VGIDPEAETGIKTWWQITRGRYIDGADEAVIGATAAEVLKLDVGDSIDLNSKSRVIVAGILEETGPTTIQVFVPLIILQKSFDKEGLVSTIDIRALCTACPVEVISDAINRTSPGLL
jgi:putative ABC transport system permease protein